MKKSVIQDSKVDDVVQRRKNEETLKVPLELYRSFGRITEQSLLEEIAPHMSQIEFLKKNCPEGTKMEEFAVQACSYFKLEYFKYGQIVFNYGEYGDKVYLILKGEVGVFVSRSQDEIAMDKEVIETYRNNLNPFEEETLDYETVFKRKKTLYQLSMDALLAGGNNPLNINNMYFKEGVCQYKRVYQFYSGQVFGDMALTSDKPRTASIIVLSDELHVLSMNRQDFKSVGEKSIKEKNQTFEYFLSIFVGVSKFIVTKFIQYFQKIEFAPQTILWREGDEPKFFFLIVRGRVELYRSYDEDKLHQIQKEQTIFKLKTKSKKKVTLSQLSDNAFVGEAELLDNIPYRQYSCMTSDNTTAYYMEIDQFNIVRKNNPDFIRILKGKSQMISRYLCKREKDIIDNISKQDAAMEKLQYPNSCNTERRTVNEIFRDSSKPSLREIRSQKHLNILSSAEISSSNKDFSKKRGFDSSSMFIMDNKALELLKQKQRKTESTIPPLYANVSNQSTCIALRSQLLKTYRKMRFNNFLAEREVGLRIKSQNDTQQNNQQSTFHESSLKQSVKGYHKMKTLQEWNPQSFVTAPCK